MKTNISIAMPSNSKGLHNSRWQFSRRKRNLVLCLFLFIGTAAFARDKQNTPDWKLDATVKGVQFYHAVSECGGRQITFLKFVNTNNYTVNVSWKESVKTQFRTEENLFRGGQQLSLPPGETMADNCAAACKACVLTSEGIDPTYQAQIASFAFKNITVEK